MSKFTDFALRKWGRLTFGGKVALICLVLGVLFGFGYSDGSPPYGIFIFLFAGGRQFTCSLCSMS